VIYITFDDSCINFCSTWHGGPLADLCDGLRPVCVGFNVRKKKDIPWILPPCDSALCYDHRIFPDWVNYKVSPAACIAENNQLHLGC